MPPPTISSLSCTSFSMALSRSWFTIQIFTYLPYIHPVRFTILIRVREEYYEAHIKIIILNSFNNASYWELLLYSTHFSVAFVVLAVSLVRQMNYLMSLKWKLQVESTNLLSKLRIISSCSDMGGDCTLVLSEKMKYIKSLVKISQIFFNENSTLK